MKMEIKSLFLLPILTAAFGLILTGIFHGQSRRYILHDLLQLYLRKGRCYPQAGFIEQHNSVGRRIMAVDC
jgi:hypothetical protein